MEADLEFIAFDLRIAEVVASPGDLDPGRGLGISCAATLTSDGRLQLWHGAHRADGYASRMSSREVRELVEWLDRRHRECPIVTWNGLGFAFHVLAVESSLTRLCSLLALRHVDLMFAFYGVEGLPLGLKAAADACGSQGGSCGTETGAIAPQLWQEGLYEDAFAHVTQDVSAIADVTRYVLRHGGFRWTSREGRAQRLEPPQGTKGLSDWTVWQVLGWPLPNTSWMSDPIPREQFLTWLSPEIRPPVGVRGRSRRSDFEKAVSAGVMRACQHPEISAFLGQAFAGLRGGTNVLWTDPSPRWRAFRKTISEYIARDLMGREDCLLGLREMLTSATPGVDVVSAEPTIRDAAVEVRVFVTEPTLDEDSCKQWEAFRETYAGTPPERIMEALPFRGLREKLERGHRTDIEGLVEQVLRDRDEPYRFEAHIEGRNVDFLLPDRQIIIECDGERWHSSPQRKASDMEKSVYLECKGWEVYRLLFTAADVRYEVADQWVEEIIHASESRRRHRPAYYIVELESIVQQFAALVAKLRETVQELRHGTVSLWPLRVGSREEVVPLVREYASSFEETLRSVQALVERAADWNEQGCALFGEEHVLEEWRRWVPTGDLYVDARNNYRVTPKELGAVTGNLVAVSDKLVRLFREHQGIRARGGVRRGLRLLAKAYYACLVAWLTPLCETKLERRHRPVILVDFGPYTDDMDRGRALLRKALNSLR